MLKNYAITAWRNLARHKVYSLINIAGLAIGLASCILILLFVRNELSYDGWIPGADRLYRIETKINLANRPTIPIASTQGVLRDAILEDFDEIEAATRFDFNEVPVARGDRRFIEAVASVDANFFALFDFPFVEGDPKTALADLSTIVVTESFARKFFGDGPAVGEILTVDFESDLRVSAVIRDLPANTHFRFGALRPINVAENGDNLTQWGSFSFLTYLRLRDGDDIEALAARLDDFADRHIPSDLAARLQSVPHEVFDYSFVAMRDIHLLANDSAGMTPLGSMTMIKASSAIAVLILVIACINFINLATARSTQRAREVAVRKVLGANRSQLVGQFLGEAILIAIASLIVALGLVELAMPWYNALLAKMLAMDFAADPGLLVAFTGLAIIVGIGAGIHPALVLSSFRPATVLKSGGTSQVAGAPRLRAVLVVIQFAVSIALIISTAVVFLQTRYARTMDPGFVRDNILVIRNIQNPHIASGIVPFMNTLRKHPAVLSVARSDALPGDDEISISRIRYPGMPEDDITQLRYHVVDFEYFNTLGIRPIAGRLFDPDLTSDALFMDGDTDEAGSAATVINVSAARLLGFGDVRQAVGAIFRNNEEGGTEWTVIGVVPDLHFDSLRTEIEPSFYQVDYRQFRVVAVQYRGPGVEGLLAFIDDEWNDSFPAAPLVRDFLDDNLEALYSQDARRALMFGTFALLAVFVSCLGLLGLSAHSAERKTREIGIRKVFGATVAGLVARLSWQFSIPVLLANVIAWPVAWYFMSDWLDGFAYRIDLSISYFLGAGVLALFIAWATVGIHAAKVARANPIHALRYE